MFPLYGTFLYGLFIQVAISLCLRHRLKCCNNLWSHVHQNLLGIGYRVYV